MVFSIKLVVELDFKTMQNVKEKEIYEIDLSNCEDSEALVNGVVAELEKAGKRNLSVKLKLANIRINQSQMIFVKSLVESFGSELEFVNTLDELTKEVCNEIGISTFEESTSNDFQTKSETFETISETTNKEIVETEDVEGAKRQVIGVYRKADAVENELEFKDEDVDFYATPTDEAVVIDTKDTIYVNQTLRNGQILDYDGNVVIIGDCHPGSEIKATGDITVWGVLGSIAHAGIKGNKEARIRALKMNAVQLRIADCYSRRPDGGNIPFINRSSVFTPEEAKIVDDNIVLFKMAQN